MESGNVYTKQQRIAELAKQMPEAGFTSLAYSIDLEWLKEAYRRTRKEEPPRAERQRRRGCLDGESGPLKALVLQTRVV